MHGLEQVGAVEALGLDPVGRVGGALGGQHPAAGLQPGQRGVGCGDRLDHLGQLGREAAEHLGERR